MRPLAKLREKSQYSVQCKTEVAFRQSQQNTPRHVDSSNLLNRSRGNTKSAKISNKAAHHAQIKKKRKKEIQEQMRTKVIDNNLRKLDHVEPSKNWHAYQNYLKRMLKCGLQVRVAP